MRKEFEMTQAQLDTLLDAMCPVPYIIVGGHAPESLQSRANAAWRTLGNEMGFDGDTVKQIPGASQLRFTAEAIEEKQTKKPVGVVS